jgi:hypothetical protein
VYILFLAPALVATLVFSCSQDPVPAAVLGTATAISFGAFRVANVIAGLVLTINFAAGARE